MQSLEDGNAKVYFVDYGNICKIPTAHLRATKPTLLKHPFQAISCWLAGIACVCVRKYKYISCTFIVPAHTNLGVLLSQIFPLFCLTPLRAGLEPVGEEWSKDAVQMFQTLCVGKRLMGRVLSVTEKGYGVELEYDGSNIADVLIAEQLAKPSRQQSKPDSQADTFSELVEAPPAPVSAESPSHTDQSAATTGQIPAASQSSMSSESMLHLLSFLIAVLFF